MAQSFSQLDRGMTIYGPVATIDTDNLVGVDNEGAEVVFDDVDFTHPSLKLRSMRKLRARLMRNMSGITIAANRLVTHMAGYRNRRFDGYSCLTGQMVAGVIDPCLTDGVRHGDACWVFYGGPIQVYTGLAFAADIEAGSWAVAITAANSTANTGGGKVDAIVAANEFTTTDVTDGTLGKFIDASLNRIGVFEEAAASSNATNTLKYVDLKL